jgi:hypothetical protein
VDAGVFRVEAEREVEQHNRLLMHQWQAHTAEAKRQEEADTSERRKLHQRLVRMYQKFKKMASQTLSGTFV